MLIELVSILPDQCHGSSCDTIFCIILYLCHLVRILLKKAKVVYNLLIFLELQVDLYKSHNEAFQNRQKPKRPVVVLLEIK